VAKGAYVSDITFGPNSVLRGHWADRLEAIERDLADMEAESKKESASRDSSAPAWAAAIVACSVPVRASKETPHGVTTNRCEHLPPASFHPGKSIPLEISVEAGYQLASATLHYRHVDQSDEYRTAEMSADGGRYRAVIPGEYTDSPYPLLYYFVLREPRGAAWLHPGLNAELANQPYFIVRQA
jgi:hypothetical protein